MRALAASLFAALLLVPAAGTHGIKEGGTFLLGALPGSVNTIDPALVRTNTEYHLSRPTCGNLLAYPSKPLPEGGRLRPELAEADPVVSKDGRTYTFTVRKDARFSDGSTVTARAFVRALERIADPLMTSDVTAGHPDIVGRSAKGRTLTLKLSRRDPRFLDVIERVCAVPPSLPTDPEGARAPLPSPAPYYVAEYVPGDRLVLARNRFYRGERQHHVERFVADLSVIANVIIDDVASSKLDFGSINYGERAAELRQRYGVNRSQGQFYVQPGTSVGMFVLNVNGPLFKNNAKLRQAVNFAVDRNALAYERDPSFPGTLTDQYLSPNQPGFRDEHIYPLKGPDLPKARALAQGRTRSGRVVLYTRPTPIDMAQAQVLRYNLKAIGLDLDVVTFPGQLLFEKLDSDRKLFDIGRVGWVHSPDPAWFSEIFDGRTIGQAGNHNWSYFNSPKVNRVFDEASRLKGDERERALGELDIQLARDAVGIPYVNPRAQTFVSARTRCVVVNPFLDLTAVCLK